jgi:homopolymeric O-antigen transport system permease protein
VASAADIAEPARDAPPATTVIEPASGWSFPRLADLSGSRDLIYFLARRDVAVRYKQTAIGGLWAVLQPLLLAAVFSIFLGQLANVPSEGTPYALFALTGMTLWLFFANAFARSSESTVTSSELISKVYFPRLALPVAAVIAPIVDFGAAFVVLVVVLLIGGIVPSPAILLVPVVLAVAVALAVGIGLWLSALVVRYRDVSLVVAFLIQLMLFITPILYPLSLIPDGWQELYAINPLVGVMETFRWAMLPDASAPGLQLLISASTGILLVISGLAYFQRAERRFADLI